MQDFTKLRVWERAHRLALEVSEAFARCPRRRFAHVISQGQRAALSVSTNVVEGCGHDTRPQFARYLQIALTSAHDVQYDLLVARDLGLLADARYVALARETTEVKKMLLVLVRRVRGEP